MLILLITRPPSFSSSRMGRRGSRGAPLDPRLLWFPPALSSSGRSQQAWEEEDLGGNSQHPPGGLLTPGPNCEELLWSPLPQHRGGRLLQEPVKADRGSFLEEMET